MDTVRSSVLEAIRVEYDNPDLVLRDDSTMRDINCDRADLDSIVRRLSAQFGIPVIEPEVTQRYAVRPDLVDDITIGDFIRQVKTNLAKPMMPRARQLVTDLINRELGGIPEFPIPDETEFVHLPIVPMLFAEALSRNHGIRVTIDEPHKLTIGALIALVADELVEQSLEQTENSREPKAGPQSVQEKVRPVAGSA